MKNVLKSGEHLKRCFLLISIVFVLLLKSFAQTDGIPRGAQLPYTRYEAENGTRGGSAGLQQTLNYDYNTIASEASNQKYVSLPSSGAYVEWTTTASAQGFNLRFTMPDDAAGNGLTGSLTLSVNGSPVKTINLSSYWAYQYFHSGQTEPEQTPGGKTFMRFDEVHFRLDNPISSGSTIRISKTTGDPYTYGVDFIELEPVPAALSAPANSISVTAYGAIANDQTDDFAAFNACLAAAAAQGKSVYIPSGRFLLSDKLPVNVSNMKIQGAGIWYTELYFSTDKQFYGGIFARATNVEISDFSLNTANNDRFKYNESNARIPGDPYKIYKGFMGTYGSGSRIHDVWVEHFECGFWIGGYDPPYPIDITTDLVISRARIRNNYADGVNFCQGTNNSVVEYSSIRNSGDDGLAIWPNNFQGAPQERNNIFRYNTIENTWRAGGIAIFGGTGHQIYRCIIKDGVGGSAIRFTNDFPGYTFEQGGLPIIATDNYIVSCGTSYDLWDRKRGAIEFFTPQGIYDIEFNNTQIINSQRHAIQLYGSIQNARFNNTRIDGTGVDAFVDQPTMDDWGGFGILAQANGNATFNTISFDHLESGQVKNHNTAFVINIIPGVVPLTGISLAPATISLPQGQNSQLTVAYSPVNATEKGITWTSSNTAVATVTAGGTGIATVTAVGVGTATITARSTDGNFTKTSTITVTPAVNIAATDASAGEGGNTGVFTISAPGVASNITVAYQISGNASGEDYTSSPPLSGSITLTAANPTQTITISPVDDTAFEGPETITLTLQSGAGYALGGSTTATINIADNESPPCVAPVVALVSGTAPVINQTIESAWSNAPARSISNVTFGSLAGDYTGQWRALYNSANLYLLVEVNDAVRTNDSGASWWEDDAIEIFIDGNNSKGATYDGQNDFQYGFRWNDAAIKTGQNSVANTTGVSFNMYATSSGYNLEVAIPWTTIGVSPVMGNTIGLDVQVDDDDNGGVRDSQTASFATGTTAWSTPGVFGTVYLTTCGTVVNVPVTGVTVSPNVSSLAVGATQPLTAAVAPANATNKNVSWTSSNTNVATVNTSGVVTALSPGTATITVTTQDGARTATATITVGNVSVTAVTVSPVSASIVVGATQQFTATVTPANATNKTLSWSTSNAAVAAVNASGLVTGVAAGSAIITVTTQDGSRTATSSVTVAGGGSLPSPWVTTDVGAVAATGSASHSAGTFTVSGSGADIWGTADEFRFVHQPVTGDVTITARVVSQSNTDVWAKAGVMIRSGVGANAQHASTLITPSNGVNFQRRVSTGGASTTTGATGVAPYWVRMVRAGNIFSSFVSSNGMSWTQVGVETITMSASVSVGLAVTSHNDGTLSTAVFDNVTVIPGTVGDPQGVVTCYRSSGTINVNGLLSESSWNISRSVSKTTVGTTNNTVTFGVLWDNTNLYIGARVLDASLFNDSSDPWENDAVEIYIDANNNKSTMYDGADNQFIKGYNTSTILMKVNIQGVQHASASITGGYTVEVSIPWSQLGISPAEGTTIGFDVGYDDDDNGGTRDSQGVWYGNVNNYQNPSGFGSLILNSGTSTGGRSSFAAEQPDVVGEANDVTVVVTPNPAPNGRATIMVTKPAGEAQIQVIGLDGRVHATKSTHENQTVLELTNTPNGVYLIRVHVDHRVITKKMIIQ